MACAHAPPSLETPAVSTSYINAPSTRSGSRSRLFTSICWRSRRCVPVPVPAPVPVPGVHTRLEMFAAAESGASSAVAFGATWLPSYQSLPLPLTHCTALHCTALHCTALHCTALHCTALHCTALHCTGCAVASGFGRHKAERAGGWRMVRWQRCRCIARAAALARQEDGGEEQSARGEARSGPGCARIPRLSGTADTLPMNIMHSKYLTQPVRHMNRMNLSITRPRYPHSWSRLVGSAPCPSACLYKPTDRQPTGQFSQAAASIRGRTSTHQSERASERHCYM
jgi:hypothetical protein